MADSEDMFLRAKHRTFSGLTEGRRALLAYFLLLLSPVKLQDNASVAPCNLAELLRNLLEERGLLTALVSPLFESQGHHCHPQQG